MNTEKINVSPEVEDVNEMFLTGIGFDHNTLVIEPNFDFYNN